MDSDNDIDTDKEDEDPGDPQPEDDSEDSADPESEEGKDKAGQDWDQQTLPGLEDDHDLRSPSDSPESQGAYDKRANDAQKDYEH
jgi:hypothetical protein